MVTDMESEVAHYSILRTSAEQSQFDPYKSFVFANFLHSLRTGNDWFKAIDNVAYYATYHRVIEMLLSRRECQVRIARLTDDPDVALGFSISRPDVLDYVFVKPHQRNQGIGQKLLPEQFTYVSHLTHQGDKLRLRHFPAVKFDPFR